MARVSDSLRAPSLHTMTPFKVLQPSEESGHASVCATAVKVHTKFNLPVILSWAPLRFNLNLDRGEFFFKGPAVTCIFFR